MGGGGPGVCTTLGWRSLPSRLDMDSVLPVAGASALASSAAAGPVGTEEQEMPTTEASLLKLLARARPGFSGETCCSCSACDTYVYNRAIVNQRR